MEWNIEKSKKEDCKLIVEFITKVWSETYRGIVNDDFLDSLKQTEKDRYINAINKFDEKNNMEYIIKENNEIIAFSKLAKTNDMHGKNIELQSLYVLKEYQNRGIGKKLIQNAFKKAKELGYKKIIVGCLENNKSNDFYKKINGKYIGKREFKLPNQTLYENVYEYDL